MGHLVILKYRLYRKGRIINSFPMFSISKMNDSLAISQRWLKRFSISSQIYTIKYIECVSIYCSYYLCWCFSCPIHGQWQLIRVGCWVLLPDPSSVQQLLRFLVRKSNPSPPCTFLRRSVDTFSGETYVKTTMWTPEGLLTAGLVIASGPFRGQK